MISVENERNFENMLFADASALPPPQDTVTPWHTAMHYILWGLGLAASCFSIAGHYVGAGMVVNNGVKVIKPIILIVLVLLLVKVVSGI